MNHVNSISASYWSIGIAAIAVSVLSSACASEPEPATPQTKKAEPRALACPSLSSGKDLGALFGIDAAMAARIDRTVRLASELEATASALATEADGACASLARDLDPAPWVGAPCAAAATRLEALRARVTATGAKLSVRSAAVRCSLPAADVARCAGECITGAPDVVSRVSCPAPDADCSGDFQLPNAPPACLVRCRARALRSVQCSADVAFEVDGAPVDPELRAALDRAQKDASRVVAIATEMASRAAELTRLVTALVDELGASVDAMTSGDAKERKVAIGAVLATCLAPPLAQTVRAGARVGGAVDGARQLHAALVRP